MLVSHRAATLAAALALVSFAPGVALAQPAKKPEAAAEKGDKAKGTQVRELAFARDLATGGDLALRGIFDATSFTFGVPEYWKLAKSPELVLQLARSPELLPDISSLTIVVDGRPVETVRLDGKPGEVWERTVSIPLQSPTGFHHVEIRAYHRSHIPCELADHPGLWSRIRGDSLVRLTYRDRAPALELSRWPYPLRDDRDPGPHRVVIVTRPGAGADELSAAAYVAASLGRSAPWRPLDLIAFQGKLADAPAGNAVVIAPAAEAKELALEVVDVLGASPDADVSAAAASMLGGLPATGVLALAPRPGTGRLATVLGMIGRDAAAVARLGVALSSRGTEHLPAGPIGRVEKVKGSEPMELRRWQRTVPPETTFQLRDMGFRDTTITGAHGGTVHVPLPLVPDDMALAGQAKMSILYSYSPEVDPSRSRLDVAVGGAIVAGVALADLAGKTAAQFDAALPAHLLGPAADVELRFHLAPRTPHECIGQYDPGLWGTVHADSKVTLGRDRYPDAIDLANVHFGAFPFGLRADLTGTKLFLPEKPTAAEIQTFTWLAAELGRTARGDRFAFGVGLGAPPGGLAGLDAAVVVESPATNALVTGLGLLDKAAVKAEGEATIRVDTTAGAHLGLGVKPDTGFFEVIRVSDKGPAVLVARAARASSFVRVGACSAKGALFDRLEGRISRVASCDDVVSVPWERKAPEPPAATAAATPTQPPGPGRVTEREPSRWWVPAIVIVGGLGALSAAAIAWRRKKAT